MKKSERAEHKLNTAIAVAIGVLAITVSAKAEVPMADENFEPHWQLSVVEAEYSEDGKDYICVCTGSCYMSFEVNDYTWSFTDGSTVEVEEGDFIEVYLGEAEDGTVGIFDAQFASKGF